MDNINNDKTKAKNIIDTLYDTYSNNKFMYEKLNNYLHIQLPNMLYNISNNHETKVLKLKESAQEQQLFTERFLNTNRYFYLPSTEYYIYYDGTHYLLISEDDLHYNIVNKINTCNNIISYKRQIKTSIIKKIKDNVLTNTIPESETIQLVMDMLYPSLFSNKVEAKYFITVLGDNILKKNTNNIHFITIKSKYFIKSLTQISQMILGNDMCHSMKHKYHNHNYEDCRLIKINECIKNENIVNSVISNNILDLISVSIHYSKRYESSDNYLLNYSNDHDYLEYVFYIKNINPDELIELFISQYIDFVENNNSKVLLLDSTQSSTQISWKNMLFLWKKFIESKQLPYIITTQNIKIKLIEKLNNYYDSNNDSFIGICSKFMPSIEKFLNFWNETIVYDETENDLEISELLILLKLWCENNNESISNLNDKQILDLIIHYYPLIEIEQEKFISNHRCILWDKQMDIQAALEYIKDTIQRKVTGQNNSNETRISIYDIYHSYCKYITENNNKKLIVNKNYFEKYIIENFQEYIVDTKFLNITWCN